MKALAVILLLLASVGCSTAPARQDQPRQPAQTLQVVSQRFQVVRVPGGTMLVDTKVGCTWLLGSPSRAAAAGQAPVVTKQGLLFGTVLPSERTGTARGLMWIPVEPELGLYNADRGGMGTEAQTSALEEHSDYAVNCNSDLSPDRISRRIANPARGQSRGFSVKAPNGKTYIFPTQAAEEKFKKAAGIH